MSGKRVALIAMYDEQALGLRCLSNALIDAGHNVVIIHFKLNVRKAIPFFLRYSDCYQVAYAIKGNDTIALSTYASDVSPWATGEAKLLGFVLKIIEPDIVGLSTRSVYSDRIKEITDAMLSTGAVTVAGGHDATVRPELYKNLGIDHVVIGDGEEKIVQIADGIEPDFLTSKQVTKDYFYRKDSNVTHFLIDGHAIKRLDPLAREIEPQIYYTMLGKGCTGKCSFCSSGQYIRKHKNYKTRILRDTGSIIEECRTAKTMNFTRIFFLDSFFVGPSDYLIKFFREYKEKVGLPFFAQLHPEQIMSKPELLYEAKKAGLYQTVVGFQSASEEINRNVFNRETSNSIMLDFSELCVSNGIEVHYHFITHNPYETEEHKRATFELLEKLPYNEGCAAVFRPLNVFPNTAIFNRLETDQVETVSFDEDCRWLALYMLKFKCPRISFEEYGDKTIGTLNRAYARASWNSR